MQKGKTMTDDRPVIEMISKVWGFEKKITSNKTYCGKLVYIVKGKNTSLRYSSAKDETFYVQSGKVHVFFFDRGRQEFDKAMAITNSDIMATMERATLNPGDNFCVPPGRIYQIFAAEDTQLFEFSTAQNDGG